MRQIENFDFDPQNKIRICCLARSLQARSLRQQLAQTASQTANFKNQYFRKNKRALLF
jgi:hypothetical protein